MLHSKDETESPPASPANDSNLDLPLNVDEKKLLWKIDLRVMPMLFLIYVVAFLDRVNISNALTMDMPTDLGLTGDQPNVALTVFFVPYVLFEIPSNILMKRFHPHIWLSGCILAFGIVMLCQGFVQSYSGLIATRFFLGLAEAGIFPGSFYLISFWYRREEAQKRFTVYWSSVMVAAAFGGLLATAISKMDGIRGLSNWRWVFILEGILTILVGITAFFLVTTFPREAKWLTEDERRFVLAKNNVNEKHTTAVTPRDVLHFFTDITPFVVAVLYFTIVVPIYAFAYFTPTIIVTTLEYSVVQTQLHSVPPFAAALGLSLLIAYLSDLTRLRLPFILFADALLITGLAILLTAHDPSNFSLEYAGICLVSMGAFSAGAVIICWYLMNLHGHVSRSIGSGWMIGFGNCGGVAAPFAFVSTDAPWYHTGYSMLMAMAVLNVVAALAYGGLVWNERRKVARTGQGFLLSF